MANRIRNERLEIKLTEEEKTLFEEKTKTCKVRKYELFYPQMRFEKEIYQIDLEPCRDLQSLLGGATNNINQLGIRKGSFDSIETHIIKVFFLPYSY